MVIQFSSVQSLSRVGLWPHELQHAGTPCPSPTPRVQSDSHPSSPWCHPAISSSVIPFSSCPQSLPGWESFPMSQLFAWGGQSTGVSAWASFFPKKSQGWSPSEWTGGCLYIFEISCLSVVSFAIIFSHSEGCLFNLQIVSFAVQKLSVIRSHLFTFVLNSHYSKGWVIEDLALIYVIECSASVFLWEFYSFWPYI